MRTIYFIIFLLCNYVSIAQETDIQGTISYGHMQSMGMGGPIGVDYNAVLIFDKGHSTYVFAKDSLEGGNVRTSITVTNEDNQTIIKPKNTSKLGFIYHFNLKEDLLESRDLGFKYVRESMPEINWRLSNEFKSIGRYKCRKASATFRGRNYTAWFTTEIPLPFGPWKLNGLPGLILEAYDTNKEVYFYFKSIKYPNLRPHFIVAPNPEIENKTWITFADYKVFLTTSYERAIQNSRMLIEQSNIYAKENARSMKDTYIEVFQN